MFTKFLSLSELIECILLSQHTLTTANRKKNFMANVWIRRFS